MVNSKVKGSRFERWVAAQLCRLGWRSRRTQQYQGMGSDGDIVLEDVPETHWECKVRAALSLYKWIDQAQRDSRGRKLCVVVAKADRREPVVIVELERLGQFIDLMQEARGEVSEAETTDDQADRGEA